jgi:hypothetical protein
MLTPLTQGQSSYNRNVTGYKHFKESFWKITAAINILDDFSPDVDFT